MNRDKQIEEMANIIRCKAEQLPRCPHTTCSTCKATELYHAGYRKASDVAREIVDDAKETLLEYHLQENKKYLASQSKTKKQFDIETARYRAITDVVKFAIATLNEIEKKYTEGEG